MSDKLRELPNNIEAEQGLLGAILIDNRTFDRVAAFLDEEHFFEPLHRRIYLVCGELIRMGKMASPITVKTFLPTNAKIGDMTMQQYLVTLAAAAVGTIAARELGIAVHEAWLAREAISAATTFLDFAYAPPPGVDVIGERTDLEDRLAQLRGLRVKSEARRGAGARYLDNMEAIKQRGSVIGVPIGLTEIQRVISEPSFEASNYYGLLSSSSEGKTSLLIQIVRHALEAGYPVLILSYDQTAEQIVRQMVSQAFSIEARRQRFGDLSEAEWGHASGFATWLDAQPFEVKDCTHEGAPQLVGYARTFTKKYVADKPALIVLDHVNAVAPEKSTERADEGTKAATINGILKAAAKSLGVPWLVLNQRNTRGMVRDNPRPIAADLYGGEAAKRAYDAVFFLYRFKKFFEERKAIASSDADWKKIHKVFPLDVVKGEKDIAEIGCIKCRFGDPNLRETLDFEARYTRYVSQEPAADQEEMSFLERM